VHLRLLSCLCAAEIGARTKINIEVVIAARDALHYRRNIRCHGIRTRQTSKENESHSDTTNHEKSPNLIIGSSILALYIHVVNKNFNIFFLIVLAKKIREKNHKIFHVNIQGKEFYGMP
jgi:hypothetical protein